jgi:hypothetical protein
MSAEAITRELEARLSPFLRMGVRMELKRILTLADLRSALKELGPATAGWLCALSEIREWDGTLRTEEIPLSGELVLSGGASVHLRRDGRAWLISKLSDEPEMPGYAFDETFEGTRPSAGVPSPGLRYRTYWHFDEERRCYRPEASRFLGWEE